LVKQRAVSVEKELLEFVKEIIEREIERSGDG
jgi:hypothetical protein